MIVAVFFGSRDWADAWAVEDVVEHILRSGDGSLKGVHGAARGLDSLADAVLRRRGFSPVSVPARWLEHDRAGRGPVPCRCAPPRPGQDGDTCRAAGIRRNQLILDEYVIPAIAMPDVEVWAAGFRTTGRSPGTDDMRARLKPLVEAGQVRGIFRKAEGLPPVERRKPRQAAGIISTGREPWPPPPWPREAAG